LPSAVTKKRTPSSSAMSTHFFMRSVYTLDDFSTMALKPTGRGVSSRMRRMPARSSCPCTKLIEMGWMMPMPPASETAAMSSGLEQGYMAPQMSGVSMPA
jgi:hypothetical protein